MGHGALTKDSILQLLNAFEEIAEEDIFDPSLNIC